MAPTMPGKSIHSPSLHPLMDHLYQWLSVQLSDWSTTDHQPLLLVNSVEGEINVNKPLLLLLRKTKLLSVQFRGRMMDIEKLYEVDRFFIKSG